jgi:hypothetical protein
VVWVPRIGKTAFVPLSLMHLFRLADTPANQTLIHELGEPGTQVTSNIVLAPRRLFIERPHGRDLEVVIGGALHPLVLSTNTPP